MRLKWYKTKDFTNTQLEEIGEMHFWGKKVGLHFGTYAIRFGFESDETFHREAVTHFFPCPNPPRKRSL